MIPRFLPWPIRRTWRRTLAAAWRSAGAERSGLDGAALEAVRRDLETHIERWAHSSGGRAAVRTELMDSVDRHLLQRALLKLDSPIREAVRERVCELPRTDAELDRYIAAGAVRLDVLRNWAGRYYRDRATGDWFDTYRKAAEMRSESVSRDLERLAGAPVHAAQHHRDAAIRGLNQALRLRLLQAPPRSRIARAAYRNWVRGVFSHFHRGRPRNTRQQ